MVSLQAFSYWPFISISERSSEQLWEKIRWGRKSIEKGWSESSF